MKIYIVFSLIIISMIGTIAYLRKEVKFQKAERERIFNNFSNVTTDLQKTRNELGQLSVSYGVLQLHKKEAEKFNKQLIDQVCDLNVKLRDAKNSTRIEYKYIVKIDTFLVERTSDTTYTAKYKDDWVALDQNITLCNNKETLIIDSLNLQIDDGLSIVEETQYKRFWIFWRKPTGSKIHIKSDNPYIDIDEVQTINFIRKPKRSDN